MEAHEIVIKRQAIEHTGSGVVRGCWAVCVCELGSLRQVRRTYLPETKAYSIIYRCLFWYHYLKVGSICVHLLIVSFHGPFDHFNGGGLFGLLHPEHYLGF